MVSLGGATNFDKVRLCIEDVTEFLDLLEINDSRTDLGKRYELCQKIAGEKVINRVENLVVACWSTKDRIKKEIRDGNGGHAASEWEKSLFESDATHMIQYLANSIKHHGIDGGFLKQNMYKNVGPKLGKTFLFMTNSRFPGALKPFFEIEGNSVPPFSIDSVKGMIGGEIYYNFDTVILSVAIEDSQGNRIGQAMESAARFCENLLETERKYLHG